LNGYKNNPLCQGFGRMNVKVLFGIPGVYIRLFMISAAAKTFSRKNNSEECMLIILFCRCVGLISMFGDTAVRDFFSFNEYSRIPAFHYLCRPL